MYIFHILQAKQISPKSLAQRVHICILQCTHSINKLKYYYYIKQMILLLKFWTNPNLTLTLPQYLCLSPLFEYGTRGLKLRQWCTFLRLSSLMKFTFFIFLGW